LCRRGTERGNQGQELQEEIEIHLVVSGVNTNRLDGDGNVYCNVINWVERKATMFLAVFCQFMQEKGCMFALDLSARQKQSLQCNLTATFGSTARNG
jgi:hypothetical protein